MTTHGEVQGAGSVPSRRASTQPTNVIGGISREQRSSLALYVVGEHILEGSVDVIAAGSVLFAQIDKNKAAFMANSVMRP